MPAPGRAPAASAWSASSTKCASCRASSSSCGPTGSTSRSPAPGSAPWFAGRRFGRAPGRSWCRSESRRPRPAARPTAGCRFASCGCCPWWPRRCTGRGRTAASRENRTAARAPGRAPSRRPRLRPTTRCEWKPLPENSTASAHRRVAAVLSGRGLVAPDGQRFEPGQRHADAHAAEQRPTRNPMTFIFDPLLDALMVSLGE